MAKANNSVKGSTKAGSKAGKGNKPAGKAGKPKASEGPKGTAGIVSGGAASEYKGVATIKVAVPSHLKSKVGAERDGSTFGKTTGLRMTHFADAVLYANGLLDKAGKPLAGSHAADDVLQATLHSEFPKRTSKGSGVQGVPTIQAISAYRAYFNAGKHGHNSDPKGLQKSASYNADGSPRGAAPAPVKAGKGKAGKGKAK